MTYADYAAGFDAGLPSFIEAAAQRSAAFATRLEDAGVTAAEIDSVAALDRVPVLTKDELIELQARHPPFGGLIADDAVLQRVFQSPGPLYEAQLRGGDPWRWAPALAATGFGADDVVLNAFSYHLSPAGVMFDEAARALGCTVLPGGVGSKQLQVRACADLGVTAYIGPPSYLRALLEEADERGVDCRRIVKSFVTAEPLLPSLREWLAKRVDVVRQGYGTAETGNIAYECDRQQGMHVAGDALVQICDLTTGEAIGDDRDGQVVVTLTRSDYLLVRLGTGDLSAWMVDGCDCGFATPRLRGWLGRVGQAVKVRGLFLHPRQVEQLMGRLDGIADYRLEISHAEHRDVVRCLLVPRGEPSDLAERVQREFKEGLRLSCEVELVETLPAGQDHFVDIRAWT